MVPEVHALWFWVGFCSHHILPQASLKSVLRVHVLTSLDSNCHLILRSNQDPLDQSGLSPAITLFRFIYFPFAHAPFPSHHQKQKTNSHKQGISDTALIYFFPREAPEQPLKWDVAPQSWGVNKDAQESVGPSLSCKGPRRSQACSALEAGTVSEEWVWSSPD